MKFSCEKYLLQNACAIAARAAASKSPIPALEGLLIQAGADAYYMLDQTEAIRKYLRDAVDYLRRAMA